jgi:outer membrane protein assembly factor BamB
MTNATDKSSEPNVRRRAILRAIAVRAVVYGLLAFVAVIYAVGPHGLLPTRVSSRQPCATSVPPQSQSENTNPGWPNWRGPNHDAHSSDTDLADSWPKEGPPVLWTRELGQGYSSVIAVENRVFTQTQSLTEQKAIALDADTGETLWEHRYGWPYDPGGMYPGPRATPSWHDGKLYLAAPDGLIACLDASDGREIWSVNVNQEYGGRGTEFGYSCSPLVEDGKVIVPVGGKFASVVALDSQTGERVWKSGSAVASYATPLPIYFKGHRQVVVFLQNELAGFDLQTGILLWERLYSTGYDEHAAAPLYAEPYLRTMQPFRGGSDLFMLQRLDDVADTRQGERLREGEAPAEPIETKKHDPLPPEDHECRLKLVRTDKQMSNDVASSVLVDGYVYGFDLREIQSRRQRPSRGEFRCMDFLTGEIRWSDKTIGQATIAVADGKLYLFNDRGEAILLRVNPERCEELARTEVFRGEICWTAPCLNRGRLYLRSPTKLACLYVGKPENLEAAARNQAWPTSALPQETRIDLNWLLGAERDAAFDLPDAKELTAWYWHCLASIGAATSIALAVFAVLKWRHSNSARGYAIATLYIVMLLAGVLATPLANRFSAEFVFTWPVALFAAHQIALMSVCWTQRPGATAKRWPAVAGAAFLVLTCLLYYDLTRRLSLGSAWYFLPTFLAAWPLAVPAARRLTRPGSYWADILWLFAAFSLYFWASAALMLWRTAAS